MSFILQFNKDYRWRTPTGGPIGSGVEHANVNSCDNNIIISSVVIGKRENTNFGIYYTIICDPDWIVRTFKIENMRGHTFSMTSDGEGNWFNENGSSAARFSGIYDLDFIGTPLPKTLPIRKLKQHMPTTGQRLRVIQIPFDTLSPKIDRQQFTCITPYQTYGFESLGQKIDVELKVDQHAVVGNYADLFIQEDI